MRVARGCKRETWGVSADVRAANAREAAVSFHARAGPVGWLSWSREMRTRCVASDQALDALVCARVARAAALGLVEPVPERDREAARREGWMALPQPDASRGRVPAET